MRERTGATARSGHDRGAKAGADGILEPALETAHGTKLPEQADLADGHHPAADRSIAQGRSQREGDRQVEPGLADGQSAGQVGIHVVRA